MDVTPAGQNAKLAQNPGSYFYLKDGLGSVTDIADGNGNPIQHYVYSAYGDILDIRNSVGQSVFGKDGLGADDPTQLPLDTSISFIGRERDFETGLYYLRARYYSPAIGRFLQQDPAPGRRMLPVTMVNPYVYAGNNPVSISDSNGMEWDLLGDLMAAIDGA